MSNNKFYECSKLFYNNNPELKNINFQTENNDKLFDIIESKYSMWKGSSGD